jgi:N-methylhydantoinase A
VIRRDVVVGSDIGGTFTDITVLGEEGLSVAKVPSTPPTFDVGAIQGTAAAIATAGITADRIESALHGTTVATNAILEGRGARTGLLTTEGFRDVLELRRARSPELYNLFYRPPSPLVPRQLRLGVSERIAADGSVLLPLDLSSAEEAVRALQAAGVEAVAISLLHSYRNPAHEQELLRHVRALLPDLYVSISSEILPEIGEYERTSTTVINAYLGPVVGAYLSRMESSLAASGLVAPILVMQSNGALMSVDVAARHPARMVESGPAAGVIGALTLAIGQGIGDAITFDMGGTTTKAGLIEGGQPLLTSEFEVGGGISSTTGHASGRGYALRLPVLDIAEVGAGGGSIIRVDRIGRVYVGPESAGADPGPAAYGRGGLEPTLTDALIVLGYINPRALAGGIELRPELARRAIAERVGSPLGLGLEEAADGAFRVALAETARAVKHVTTFRGRSPSGFSLVAYGGNGPVIGAALATELGIGRVVIPPGAGVFSSFGLLQADEAHHFVRSVVGATSPDDLVAAMDSLEVEAMLFVSQQAARAVWRLEPYAELRYREQRGALRVSADAGVKGRAWVLELIERFGSEHARTYGYRASEQDVEFVNLRVIASRRRLNAHRPARIRRESPTPPVGGRRVRFTGARAWIDVPVLDREQIQGSERGPFIVDEYDSTIVVPRGWSARLDDNGNLLLDREG